MSRAMIHELRHANSQADFLKGLHIGICSLRPMSAFMAGCEAARLPGVETAGDLKVMRRLAAHTFIELVRAGRVTKDKRKRYKLVQP